MCRYAGDWGDFVCVCGVLVVQWSLVWACGVGCSGMWNGVC